jgi:hypothetical protein
MFLLKLTLARGRKKRTWAVGFDDAISPAQSDLRSRISESLSLSSALIRRHP